MDRLPFFGSEVHLTAKRSLSPKPDSTERSHPFFEGSSLSDLTSDTSEASFDVFPFRLGTGSYPHPPKGLHLSTRHTASARPAITPHSVIASIAYCEQLGVNLQEGVPLSGEITLLYSFMGRMRHLRGSSHTPRKKAVNLFFFKSRLACRILRLIFPVNYHIRTLKAVTQVTFYLLHLHDRGVFSESYYHKVTFFEDTFFAYLSECLSYYPLSSVSLHGASDLFRG